MSCDKGVVVVVMIAIYRISHLRERRSASLSGCQSLRMCTKDMGNTPFLSGSPSMCPIWRDKEGKESEREYNVAFSDVDQDSWRV